MSIDPVPDHVPPELVRSFDFSDAPGMRSCPFAATASLHDGPPIFWNTNTPRFGASWVATRAADIRFILNHPDLFSNKGETGFSQLMGEDWDLIPLELDPPEHTKFRQLLNPLLAPKAIAGMAAGVERRAVELIEAIRPAGECEFMTAFGRPFPVNIFMQLMGLPEALTEQFLDWEFRLLHAPEIATKAAAAVAIRDYLRELADERRKRPTGDLTSVVVSARVDGRPLSDIEVQGILYLLFVGGLDTVASSLGFFFRHLGQNPADQARLRAHPRLIPAAVEELLRRFSVVTTYRQCRVDVDVNGVAMKAGDWITINDALGSLDPLEFDRPLDVDFERKHNRHLGFSYGPHFCVGNHLARRELQVALREWLARVPPWTVKPKSPIEVHGGAVFGVEQLELVWDRA
jgi:cytochrome P450